jgi:hypothetical protein
MPTPALTALLDQVHAAARQARTVLDKAAPYTGGSTQTPPRTPWLTAQLDTITDAILTGTATLCPHVDASPRLLLAAAWTPGVLACPSCYRHMLTPTPGTETTCDRCGTTDQPLHNIFLAAGPLILAYGLCPTCLSAEHITPTPSPSNTR